MKKQMFLCLVFQITFNTYSSQDNKQFKNNSDRLTGSLDRPTEVISSRNTQSFSTTTPLMLEVPRSQSSHNLNPSSYAASPIAKMPVNDDDIFQNVILDEQDDKEIQESLARHEQRKKQELKLKSYNVAFQHARNLDNFDKLEKELINMKTDSELSDKYYETLYHQFKQDVHAGNDSFILRFLSSPLIEDLTEDQILSMADDASSDNAFVKFLSILGGISHVENRMLAIHNPDNIYYQSKSLVERDAIYKRYLDVWYQELKNNVLSDDIHSVQKFLKDLLIDDLSDDQILELLHIAGSEAMFDMLMPEFQSRNIDISLINNKHFPAKTDKFRHYYFEKVPKEIALVREETPQEERLLSYDNPDDDDYPQRSSQSVILPSNNNLVQHQQNQFSFQQYEPAPVEHEPLFQHDNQQEYVENLWEE